MPDITRTDIGRRMYQLHKEKNVEHLIEMIRQHLGADWKSYSDEDIRLLERLLGDAWVGFDKGHWEKIPFGRMTKDDVNHLLAVGKYMDMDKTPKTQIMDDVKSVLAAVRQVNFFICRVPLSYRMTISDNGCSGSRCPGWNPRQARGNHRAGRSCCRGLQKETPCSAPEWQQSGEAGTTGRSGCGRQQMNSSRVHPYPEFRIRSCFFAGYGKSVLFSFQIPDHYYPLLQSI
jgi:hypothetical protein